MKNILISILQGCLCMFMADRCLSQDIIMLKNGDEIKAKVTDINNGNVQYKKWDNKTGPTYTTLKSEIFKIKYANGTQDVFKIAESEKIATNENSSEEIKKKQAVKTLEQHVKYSITKSEVLEFLSFRKINGNLQNIFGQSIYNVDFDVEINFKKKGYLVGNGLTGYWRGDFYVSPFVPDLVSNGQQFMYTVKPVEEGNSFRLGCKVEMVGSDNGFEIKGITIRTVTPLVQTKTINTTSTLPIKEAPADVKKEVAAGYIGEYKNGKKDGKGKEINKNGLSYDGDWKDDKYNGYGTAIYKNGDKYSGYWKDNLKDSIGVLLFAPKFSSKVLNNTVFTLNSQMKLDGFFKEDKFINGICTWYDLDKGTRKESAVKDGVFGKFKKVK